MREAVEHDPTRCSVLAVDETPSVLQLLVLGD